MRTTIAIVIFFVVALAEVTLMDSIELFSVRPSLFLIVVIYISLFWGRRAGMWFGFTAGIFLDLFAPQHMGLNTLLLACTGFAVGSMAGSLYREKYASQVLILLMVSLAEALLYFAISSDGVESFVGFFTRYGLLGALYTTAVGALFFYTFHLARPRLRVP
jgi:rod shape-determining protein MreD